MSFASPAPQAPAAPPPPPPPPNPPLLANGSIQQTGAAQRAAAAQAFGGLGFSGTEKTGGQGAAAPSTAGKELLGQ